MFKNKISIPVVASSGGGKAKIVIVKQSDLEKAGYDTDFSDTLKKLKKDKKSYPLFYYLIKLKHYITIKFIF